MRKKLWYHHRCRYYEVNVIECYGAFTEVTAKKHVFSVTIKVNVRKRSQANHMD
jgi:hypothetical protein